MMFLHTNALLRFPANIDSHSDFILHTPVLRDLFPKMHEQNMKTHIHDLLKASSRAGTMVSCSPQGEQSGFNAQSRQPEMTKERM